MENFLYLTESEWAKTWVVGGEIPIKLASSYLSDNREGVMTPDENLIHESEVPIPNPNEKPESRKSEINGRIAIR